MPPFEPFPKMEVIRDFETMKQFAVQKYYLLCQFCGNEAHTFSIGGAIEDGWAVVVDNGKKRLSCPDCTNVEE